MQHLGSAAAASTASHSPPEVDMPVDEIIDVGAPWTTAGAPTAAAGTPVGDQAGATATPEKASYALPAGGAALEAKMDHDVTSGFEVDIGGGGWRSLEDFIAGGVDEFLDTFRTLDGPDGDGAVQGFGGMPGLSAGDQGMEVDDDELAWINSPDAFMPLPITEDDGLGQVTATATPTGEEEAEAGMAWGGGDANMTEEDVGEGSLVAGFGLAVPEAATVETFAPAAAAAVATITTTLPPVALEGDTVEGSGISGDCEYTVSPHAPAYDFGAGGGGGDAGYVFAGGGPADGAAAVVGAVGVGVSAPEAVAVTVTPMAPNMIMVNGGGGYDGGLSQKEVARRQKVERYLAKKKRRRWSKASSYQSRQRVANSRPRHKGRFLPLVSDFVPISELKRRQRALLAQQAQEEEDKQASTLPLAAPGWDASAQFPVCGNYGQGEG